MEKETGYRYPSQNPKSRNKTIKTWVKNYKVDHPQKFKQIKNKKSWFKLIQVGLFRYFFADLFPIFNNYYYLCDKISV